MDEELQRLCDFFERLNKQEDGRAVPDIENQIIREEDVSLENIEKFDDFVRKNGGHTGGWDAPEHAVFLKLLKKGGIRSVVPLLRSRFPDISEDDIMEHNAWYTKYIALKSRQEHTLRYWRMNKFEKEKLEKDEERECVSVKNQTKIDENIKLKIRKWKEEQRKLREEARRRQKYEEQKKEEQEKLRRAISENKKKMVVEYRREKEIQNIALMAARQAEKVEQQKVKASRANKMLSKFRRKDLKLIQNARLKKQTKLLKEQEKRELLELIAAKSRKHVRAGRDPIRLLVPTIEWKQKMKNRNPLRGTLTPPPLEDRSAEITNVQHLATPNWRKELLMNGSAASR